MTSMTLEWESKDAVTNDLLGSSSSRYSLKYDALEDFSEVSGIRLPLYYTKTNSLFPFYLLILHLKHLCMEPCRCSFVSSSKFYCSLMLFPLRFGFCVLVKVSVISSNFNLPIFHLQQNYWFHLWFSLFTCFFIKRFLLLFFQLWFFILWWIIIFLSYVESFSLPSISLTAL